MNAFYLIILFFFTSPCFLYAKTIQPLFEDPFDIGAGGSTLTRSTQEGILINGPAQLPYGGKFMRWIGIKTIVAAGKDSVDLAQNMAKGSSEASDGSSSDLINQLFKKPIHLGVIQSAALITNNGGLMVFGSLEPDLRAFYVGDPEKGAGTPSIVIRNETYGGAYASLAQRSYYKWFSFGISGKYLLIDEKELNISLTDPKAGEKTQEQLGASSASFGNKGFGMDFSSLIFLQGQYLDFRLAANVQDLFGTKFQGSDGIVWPQSYHAGLSLSLHNYADVIHFSADLRDITNVYEESWFKRLHLGTRILLRTYLGTSFGVYHGSPTYGVEIDLILFRLSAAMYTREYGKRPKVDERRIYLLSITTGLGF